MMAWPNLLTHICVTGLNEASVNKTTAGSDNGVEQNKRQDIIWTNVGLLLIRPLETKFSKILFKLQQVWCKKILLKFVVWQKVDIFLSLNVLTSNFLYTLWHFFNLLLLYLCAFPIWVRQLFNGWVSVQKYYCVMPKKMCYFCPNWKGFIHRMKAGSHVYVPNVVKVYFVVRIIVHTLPCSVDLTDTL